MYYARATYSPEALGERHFHGVHQLKEIGAVVVRQGADFILLVKVGLRTRATYGHPNDHHATLDGPRGSSIRCWPRSYMPDMLHLNTCMHPPVYVGREGEGGTSMMARKVLRRM